MTDPYVRETGRLLDIDGQAVAIGVEYDSVSVKCPPLSMHIARLNRTQAEEFAQLFVAACWEAGLNARQMAEEASDGVA